MATKKPKTRRPPTKPKPFPDDALNVTILRFDEDEFACYGTSRKPGYRVYCRRKDRTEGVSTAPAPKPAAAVLAPMPALPPKDTRPKRYYKQKRYLGINFKRQTTLGEWETSLAIASFFGRPANVYMYQVIIEYNTTIWAALIARIKSEAAVYGRTVVIHEGENGYAYTVPKMTTTKI